MNIIGLHQKKIFFESATMSIAELSSMYSIGGLIQPLNFSDFYKLKIKQKSRLIESILIAVPLKYFIMLQNYDASWQVLRGGKRLSAIFSFMGVDRNFEPYPLSDLKYCTELSGVVWDERASQKNKSAPYLSNKLRQRFLGEKVNIKIIDKGKLGWAGMKNFENLYKSEE